ncbi:phage tail protein [Iodidimonas gelatinilytica]|uniref:phage tail protein n=1 Tax=Iodidimonas gelatinilytica TaxID=1236966 RepID=UPI00123091E9|nr:phage tail protein [Iodidimonas gelatinilytica]
MGAAIGSVIDRSVFLGGGSVREGPRLSDLSVQSSALGETIPLVFGTARVSGNVIWSSGLIEKRSEEKQSGGKGRKSTSTVTFSYSVSLAVGLGARPIQGVRRIWADGKLLRDEAGRWLSPATLRVYQGTETQNPDVLIEAHEGIANAPAFRGMAYAVLEGLELAEFANRVPNLSFEVIADDAVSAGDLLVEIAARSGVETAQATGLDQSVEGLALARDVPSRSAIEGVMGLFPASVSEGGGVLSFRSLDAGDERTVFETDMGAGGQTDEDRWAVHITREQGADLLQELSVRYGDPQRDYQPALQRARRQQGFAGNRGIIDSPLFLSGDRAKRQVEQMLALSWMKQETHQLRLTVDFASLDAGDRLAYQLDETTVRLLIEEMDIAPDGVLVSGYPVSTLPNLDFNSSATGNFTAPVVELVGSTEFQALDLPGLGTSREPLQVLAALAGGSPGWRGGSVYLSRDGGETYDILVSSRVAAIMGEVLTFLPQGPSAYWDEQNEIRVRLMRPDMQLESRTSLAVLNGANRIVAGNEIIQFRDAFLDADGSYRLRGLLRGRNGTEWAMNGHQPGERFVLLDGGGLVEMTVPESLLGQSMLIKAVSVNNLLNDADPETLSYQGRSLMPLAPVHVKASREGQDLVVRWVRRTRQSGDWVDGRDVPLGEERELYELDILDAGQVVRTISTSQPELIYSVADQVADFGAPRAEIEGALYQVSALVGRGFSWTGLL